MAGQASVRAHGAADRRGFVCALAAGALLSVTSTAAVAQAASRTEVYLLRGWFGVFSTGLDTMADQLKARGVRAEVLGHLAWKAAATRIAKERTAGTRLVLVGHSQGGNNVIDMARELERQQIPVDLLITLAPWGQEPVPGNVRRAINYYQAGGWGSPLVAEAGARGRIDNIDIGNQPGVAHINIDKSAPVQAAVLEAIATLPDGR